MHPPLPQPFWSDLQQLLPDEALQHYQHQYLHDLPCTWRINRRHPIAEDTMLNGLQEQGIPCQPHPNLAWVYGSERQHYPALQAHPYWQAGHIVTQGLSSMAATVALEPQLLDTVLDMTAAPGGKTQHLAESLSNDQQLSAVEKSPSRYHTLKKNLARWRIHARTYCRDARLLPPACNQRFDRILLDAPCSSEARFRANQPNSFRYWSPRKVNEMQRQQKGLLKCAWRCLQPGGWLLYSTCTFSPQENEQVIDDFCRHHPDARIMTPKLPSGIPHEGGRLGWQGKEFTPEVQHTCRILPGPWTSGFFMALLQKNLAPNP